MTGLHWGKQGAQHPETNSSVEGGVYGALTEIRSVPALTDECDDATPLDDAERSALLAVLESQRWHMTRSAEQLSISRNTLYRKLRKHAISPRR